jgi:hypothetical protein
VKLYSYAGRAQIFLKFCWAKQFITIYRISAKQFKSHFTFLVYKEVQRGRILRRFVLRRFTLTTLVQSDRALPTCGASLSQLKHPFYTWYASSSFPLCTCFFFFYFSAVLLSWLWFFHPWPRSKRKKRNNQNSCRHILSWRLLNHSLGLLQQNKKWIDWYFFSVICVMFYIPNSLN